MFLILTDSSSQVVLRYHDETTQNYRETIENLQRVNKSVAFILNTIDLMQHGLNNKLDWLTEFVGGTGMLLFLFENYDIVKRQLSI